MIWLTSRIQATAFKHTGYYIKNDRGYHIFPLVSNQAQLISGLLEFCNAGRIVGQVYEIRGLISHMKQLPEEDIHPTLSYNSYMIEAYFV